MRAPKEGAAPADTGHGSQHQIGNHPKTGALLRSIGDSARRVKCYSHIAHVLPTCRPRIIHVLSDLLDLSLAIVVLAAGAIVSGGFCAQERGGAAVVSFLLTLLVFFRLWPMKGRP